jgi:hypothetical protein
MEGNINKEQTIQGLLDGFLKARARSATADSTSVHLDEDSVNAFVEGRIGEREATGMVKHLVDCSFCLHVTAEAAKLSMAFADETEVAAQPVGDAPASISSVLSGILSKIFGTTEGAVFAHHEEETKPEEEEKDETK